MIGALVLCAALLAPPAAIAGGGTRPTLSDGSISGVHARRPTLKFKLAAGDGSPPLSSFVVLVPPGLSFVPGKVRRAVSPGDAEASLHDTRDRLTVTLPSPRRAVSVSIAPPGMAESKGLLQSARQGKLSELAVEVKAVDATGAVSKVFVYQYFKVTTGE